MKIVIVNGSPRRNGATAAILHSIEKQLLSLGADVEYYDLSVLNMIQCRGCCACYSTGKCVFNDDAEALFHRIIFSAGIKPFVKKKGDLYKGVTDKWAEIGI